MSGRQQKLVKVLADWSGLDPADPRLAHCALSIRFVASARYERPSEWLADMKDARRKVRELEHILRRMSFIESSDFGRGMKNDPNCPTFTGVARVERAREVSWALDALACIRAGTVIAERAAVSAIDEYPAVQGHPDYRSGDIGCVVADFYVGVQGKEPPKRGKDGPFQRLVRDVFAALGEDRTDMRAVLKKVHEYRRKRFSCS